MFSVITNIYNKKTKGCNLMELFTATGKRHPKKTVIDTNYEVRKYLYRAFHNVLHDYKHL